MKLTNKEAADVIMRIQIQLGRRNGKMLLSSALLKAVEVLREAPEWIPIKMRPGTDEEYEKFSLYGDCPREDFRVFECPLPDDDQEVLVTTRWGDVCIDNWHRDIDCSWFEDHEDIDEVIAWMPLPKPYEKEGESDADS